MIGNTRKYAQYDEEVCEYTHPSGLKVQIIPKPGYYKKFAMFSVNYGSVDARFIVPGETDVTEVPDGVAHFLEHKLFDQKDGNVLDMFVALGASPNAFTSFTKTSYYFTCTEKFDECFKLLLNFVQNPYLTPESVEKEKGIIGQEIKMYQDNADWVSIMNLFGLMYHTHPIKKEIAGTIETIAKIDADILYKCHKTFYHPSNMVVTVVGDVDPQKVADMVMDLILIKTPSSEIKRVFDTEPLEVSGKSKVQKMTVSAPMFNIGFKDNFSSTNSADKVLHEVAATILKEMIFGLSSELYEELYNLGLINQSFSADYDMDTSFAMATVGGKSPNPDAVKNHIISKIIHFKNDGLNQEDFTRIRNSSAGKFLKKFNSVEFLGKMSSSAYFQGVDIFDYFDAYGKITFEDILPVFNDIYIESRMSISIVIPDKEES